jgi:hypothetical protein
MDDESAHPHFIANASVHLIGGTSAGYSVRFLSHAMRRVSVDGASPFFALLSCCL